MEDMDRQELRPLLSKGDVPGVGDCCGRCRRMFGTAEGFESLISERGYRHSTPEELPRSASAGCPLCGFLHRNLMGLGGNDPTPPDDDDRLPQEYPVFRHGMMSFELRSSDWKGGGDIGSESHSGPESDGRLVATFGVPGEGGMLECPLTVIAHQGMSVHAHPV